MTATERILDGSRYARCIESSKRVRWDIDEDVIRPPLRRRHKFLPDGLSLAGAFTTLSPNEKRFVSQIQGRTYAKVFGLVERFINAKVLELGRAHALGDQEAVEALVRFSDEELKHQAPFRRVEAMVGEVLPYGYRFNIDPNTVARAVLGKCTWAVLVLTLDIELFTQAHYRQSIDPDTELSELYRDVFLHHWKEECQHAILDEVELVQHDATLTAEEREQAVDEFIELVAAVDGILKAQSAADAGYFVASCGRAVGADEARSIEAAFLAAHRWQYIHSGARHPHFAKVLSGLITESQGRRIRAALATLHLAGRTLSTNPSKARRSVMDGNAMTTAPKVVNGINVDDLVSLIEGVRQDPAKGVTRWHVATTWQGQTRSRSQVEGFGIGGEQVTRRFAIDIDEPCELGGSNRFANPQEYLIAALNACMTVGYVAQCAVHGIMLESLVIETEGEIDLRGFLGIDPTVAKGYESLRYRVRIKGDGTKEQFAEIHEAVMATSPNFYNLSQPVAL